MTFKNITSPFVLKEDGVYLCTVNTENGLYKNGKRYANGEDAGFLTPDEYAILKKLDLVTIRV